jgi:hypothetical protein
MIADDDAPRELSPEAGPGEPDPAQEREAAEASAPGGTEKLKAGARKAKARQQAATGKARAVVEDTVTTATDAMRDAFDKVIDSIDSYDKKNR